VKAATNATSRFVLLLALLGLTAAAGAAGKTSEPAASSHSLSELARHADLVALVQVMETDYTYARSFPNAGSAYLKILIDYKRKRAGGDTIEVYEKGLRLHECYFPSPGSVGTGGRFLVFLRVDPGDPDRYRGLPEGCALQVLVRSDQRYALRYPVDGIAISDPLDTLAQPYRFEDPHAVIDADKITPQRRNELLARGLIERYGDDFKYTHGVDLTAARKLIDEAALSSRDRK
jgi:hypothetical protein